MLTAALLELFDDLGAARETQNRIREFIHIKNFYGLSGYVEKLDIPEHIKKAINGFENLFGGMNLLKLMKILLFHLHLIVLILFIIIM